MEQEPNASRNAGLGALIEQLGISDPRLKMVAEYLAVQESPPATGDKEEVEREGGNAEEAAGSVRDLVDAHEALQLEYRYLVERIEALGSALGACPTCWGEDSDCEECAGRGGPGAYPPDRASFEHYVLPLLRRMKARDGRDESGRHKGGSTSQERASMTKSD